MRRLLHPPPHRPSGRLALTLAPEEGLHLAVVMVEHLAGVLLPSHPALLAQAQGAAAAVASALLLLQAAQDALRHLLTVHLPRHRGSLRRVAAQEAGQRGRAPGELLRGGGQQRHGGPDHGAGWRKEQRHTRSRSTSAAAQQDTPGRDTGQRCSGSTTQCCGCGHPLTAEPQRGGSRSQDIHCWVSGNWFHVLHSLRREMILLSMFVSLQCVAEGVDS